MHSAAQAILVVDDNGFIREMLKSFLEAAGYAVLLASDGHLGLSCFRRHRPQIALLLTDVEMPQMSGLEMAERILEIDAALPVLFMSGSHCEVSLGHGCLKKPFDPPELLVKVAAALQPVWPGIRT